MALSLLSCGREITGPDGGLRFAHGVSFLAEYPGYFANAAEGSGSVVEFDRVRVLFVREDGSTALDRVVEFGPGTDSVALALSIPLSSSAPASGEPLDFSLFYLNAAGDTVFRGGPLRIVATPSDRNAPPPEPIGIELAYTGPGAEAVSVAILPETLIVVSGDPFAFTATAQNAQQTAEPDAPLVFTSLDPLLAVLPSRASGSGTAGVGRGTALVQVSLATDVDSDTAVLIVTPRPQAITVTSGGAQTARLSSMLPDSVRVRLVATDGLGIADAPLVVAVTTGGGTVDLTALVTDADGYAHFRWTLGPTVGEQRVTVSGDGVPDLIVTALATATPAVASQLVITQQPAAVQGSGVAISPAITVEARDTSNVLVTSYSDTVTIAFGQNPGEGALGGTLRVAAVAGVATFDDLTIANVAQGYSLVVSAAGLTGAATTPFEVGASAAASLELVSGGGQTAYVGEAVAEPIEVRVLDLAGNPVEGVTVVFAASADGALTGATPTTDALGIATLGSWTLASTAGTNTLTATVSGVTPLSITATGELPPPAIVLSVFGSTVVGVERAGTLDVQLLQPAPAGGLTVTIVSDSTQYLTIAAPGTVAFAAGATQGSIQVSGLSLGNAVVVATAPGYQPDTLVVPVSLNLISLPTTLNVPLSQTRSMPVQISTPAPAGGVRVALSSSDPSVARPSQDSVTIAAGSQTVNAIIEGVALGTARITATNPNYALDESDVSVTAEINITNSSLALNGSFGTTMTVRLESGGAPISAPVGGVDLVFTAVDPTCLNAPAAATIPAGNVSITLGVSYGGSATLACSTLLRVTGPAGYAVDSVTANVATVPAISIGALANIASGLQRNISASLGASNHGGTTVRITSLDSSIVRVSPNSTTPGLGAIDMPVGINGTSVTPFFQSVEGFTNDSVGVMLEAPGFRPDTIFIRVWQPVIELGGVNTTGNTLSGDDAFWAQIGTPNSVNGTAVSAYDDVRAGGVPISVSFVSDNANVATLATSTLTADSLTLTIPPGTYFSPTSVAGGGVAVRYQSAGTGSVRAWAPGFRPIAGATRSFTVSQPSLSLSTSNFGAGLQRSTSVSSPGAPAPAGGTTVVLRLARTGVARLAPDATTVGAEDSLVVVIPAGGTAASFVVQGVDSIVGDSVLVTATSPGFTTSTAWYRVWQPVYEIGGLSATATSLTGDDAFWVQVATPSSAISGASSYDDRAPGTAPLSVTFISDSSSVGTLIDATGLERDTITLVIPVGTYFTPTSVAGGGVAFRYRNAGVGTVQSDIPTFRRLPGAVRTVTVTAPAITVGGLTYIGSGLQRARSVSLGAPAPAGGLTVTIAPDSVGVVLLSASNTVAGVDTLQLTIPQGSFSSNFYVQALDAVDSARVTLTATAPAFTAGTGTQNVWTSVVELGGLGSSFNTLSADDPFQVLVGSTSSRNGASVSSYDERRPGGAPLMATVATSTATVGQLVTAARTDDTVTVAIPAGSYFSANSVASGGVAFDALTTGTASISATIPGFRSVGGALGSTVNVVAPSVTLNATASSGIGAGLQYPHSGSLSAGGHGGIDLVIRSSNPAVARVARLATDIATDSIIIPITNGGTSFSYYIAGVEGATGQVTITATATGFTDASVPASIVTPRFEIGSLTTSRVAGGTDDPFWVQLGVPNATGTGISSYQDVRAGSSGLTFTFTSSDAVVGTLVTTQGVAASVQVTVPALFYYTPTSVASGGVAFRYLTPGTTTVTATTPTLQPVTGGGSIPVTVTSPP